MRFLQLKGEENGGESVINFQPPFIIIILVLISVFLGKFEKH